MTDIKIIDVGWVEVEEQEVETEWMEATYYPHLRRLPYPEYRKEISGPVSHSDCLQWDPRDDFISPSPMPTDWIGAAKAVVFLAIIAGIAIWVAW
jgi:hypothetical protein